MDRTTIIQAWREVCGSDLIMAMPPTGRLLEKFASKVAAIERERCAKLCEAEKVEANLTGEPTDHAYNTALRHAAAAIRAS
jgi:hypothetical protein